jgi:CBS domain-containing protein
MKATKHSQTLWKQVETLESGRNPPTNSVGEAKWLSSRGTAMDTKIQTLLDRKGHKVHSIRADQSVYEAISEMDAKHVGSLIVMDGEKVVGIITERDYLRKVILRGRSSKDTTVETIMTRNLVSIGPDHTIEEAMTLVTDKRCRHLPVFEGQQLIGILSIGDLVKWVIANQQFEIHVLEDYISSR